MEGKYEVTYRGQAVGAVEVKQEGLYCRLSCRCRMVDGEIHRLYAQGEKLGVLTPDRGELVLETRVAAKRLKGGCAFTLDEKAELFIPIRPGEVFGHLNQVRSGRLAYRDGQAGVLLGR